MTKGVLDYGFARNLHSNILPVLVLISFVSHSSLGIRNTLIRLRIWNKITALLLIIFYLVFFSGFIYLEFFYQKKVNNQLTWKKLSTDQEQIFSIDELALYNGKNGMPAYSAVDGVIYDLTSVFIDGLHYQHPAGQDLTEAFYLKHTIEQILKHPVVGRLNLN